MTVFPESPFRQAFPALRDGRLLADLQQHGKWMSFAVGEKIITAGAYPRFVPLVVRGSIKVMREDADGRELFLYYLNPGETCAMSLTCCNAGAPSEISAVAEEPTEILAVPIRYLDEWTTKHREWKELVAQTYAHRFQELLHTLDGIAFRNMDERLWTYLQTKARQLQKTELSVTHQEIATELGTSREVVSRLLKQLEKTGAIRLGRNKIEMTEVV